MIVTLLFYFIYGIIGVNYFKGKYFACSYQQTSVPFRTLNSGVGSKWDCLNAGGEWLNSFMNFDNTIQAISTLFVMSNMVGWKDIMYQGSSN